MPTRTATAERPVVVALDELAGRLGAPPELVESWARRLGVALVEGRRWDDPEPVSGVSIIDAGAFLAALRAEIDTHSQRNADYHDYLAARKAKAMAERQAAINAARKEEMERSRIWGRRHREREAQRAAEEAAAAADERAAREGRPDTFEKFVSSH